MTDKKPKIKYKKRRISPEIRAAKHERRRAEQQAKYAEWRAKVEQEYVAREMALWAIESDLRRRYTVDEIFRLAAEHEHSLGGYRERDLEFEDSLRDLEDEVRDTESGTFKLSSDGSIEFIDDHLNQAEGIFGGVARLAALSAYKGKIIHSKWKAQQGAKARLNNDPRQKEKEFIKDCWIDWQADKSKYKSKAEFSRDMLKKVEKLTSQKKIEDWCREWEKEYTT